MQLEQLGPYRLGKQLGRGGMGAVYEAVDTQTGEQAAVKVLSPHLAAEEGFRVRFEAEIESLKKLRHPNIVRLYGYGEQSGTLFYAMELVHGTSLEDELRRGRRFDWREVTRIAIQTCRALKHAHDHGVIHRDIKPANLLLTTGEQVKLSDFGIARLFGNTRLTSDGGVLGTAEFMAPEQAAGRALTDRCDQYSLGGLMYTLLAGRPPFRATTIVEMLQLQRYAEPEPISVLAPQTPQELGRIVHQLLEKDPQRRFRNALILARSLEAMERGLSVAGGTANELAVTPPEGAPRPERPLAATLSPDELAPQAAAGPGPLTTPPASEATMAYQPSRADQAGAAQAESTDTAPAADRFTKVSDANDEGGSLREAFRGLLAPQTMALVAALALLVAGGWYMMRPPTADELFKQIETAIAAGDPEDLKTAQPDIQQFLERFPNDPRAGRVQALADEAEQSSPVERAYAEAKRAALLNPALALAKFQAIVDVYDDGPDNSEVTRHWVRLARTQQARLQKRVDKYVAEGRKLLEARMDKAEAISPNEPQVAQRMYRGIIELYSDKPWAGDLVERARDALAKASRAQAAAK